MNARLVTDRDDRMAAIDDVELTRVAFPGSTEAQQDSLARLLETEIVSWDMDISMDRLLTTLELAATRRRAAEGLSMEPPVILFRQEPAILVTIDGEPRLQQIEGSDLMRILNTAFTIIFDQGSRTYYLAAGEDQWYSAPEYDGPWTLTDRVPSDVAVLAPEPLPEEEQPVEDAEADDQEPGPPPAIVVATEPTELIVIDGEPEYTPISGTDLMYVTNSESDVLLDLESARYFVILSGRWFTSASYEGPWVNVPADQLSDRFSQIPLESEMGHVRVSVPETIEAKEAVMENQIPQTSAITRDTKLTVEYDGDPEFEPIEGTSMTYAVNTADQVIRVGNEYYACHEAVWYEAENANGTWDQKTRDGWQGNDAVTRDAARDRAAQGGADVQRPSQQPAQRPEQRPAQQPQARQQQPQTSNVSWPNTGSSMQQNSSARSRGTTRTQDFNSQRSRSAGGRSGGRRR